MSVTVSPISRTAALLIIVIGVFMLVVGQSTGILEDSVAGTAFIILGIIMHGMLYRLAAKNRQERN